MAHWQAMRDRPPGASAGHTANGRSPHAHPVPAVSATREGTAPLRLPPLLLPLSAVNEEEGVVFSAVFYVLRNTGSVLGEEPTQRCVACSRAVRAQCFVGCMHASPPIIGVPCACGGLHAQG